MPKVRGNRAGEAGTTKPNVFEPQSCFCAGFVVGLHVPPPWATRNVCVIPWREFLQVRFVKGTCSNRDGWLVVDRAEGVELIDVDGSVGVRVLAMEPSP